jgi:hypothetical protein
LSFGIYTKIAKKYAKYQKKVKKNQLKNTQKKYSKLLIIISKGGGQK